MLVSTEAKVQIRVRTTHTLVYEECDLSDGEAEARGAEMANHLAHSGLYVVVITSHDYVRPVDPTPS